ncbi:isocitrate lyase/phosphoenolpyruvate mutase family protein [Altererythrobacter soli]|uniref:Isocitrate lyase/phosphoenolpyruvate mutase family protein n=1 Tax=Croceibacterium soli TaxID=1739690 RepID=A0A6I4UU86_9SPHN|nr:isocitrate lyase/phosphoenolpyruvate mutase family protein [Croceibacterium soli]MXP42472.1 isocitrate lyase/phosphoenolpyruvate mutase family protein [Croceibacterium soli]
MSSDFATFAALHVAGDPLVLYNIWDPGSAKAVAGAGAKALATGSHPVGDASGFGDGQRVPLSYVFDNARRIIAATDLPLTVDFEGAYSTDPEEGAANVARLKETGVVGCNLKDQVIGGEGLHPIGDQVDRITSIRSKVGEDFFINARTDLMLKAKVHDEALVDQIIERGQAFADAGASGLFVPRLSDPRHVERVVREVPLPLNLIAFPGAPSKQEWAAAGVARISHGPFPFRTLMEQLQANAKEAFA